MVYVYTGEANVQELRDFALRTDYDDLDDKNKFPIPGRRGYDKPFKNKKNEGNKYNFTEILKIYINRIFKAMGLGFIKKDTRYIICVLLPLFLFSIVCGIMAMLYYDGEK